MLELFEQSSTSMQVLHSASAEMAETLHSGLDFKRVPGSSLKYVQKSFVYLPQ